MIPILILAASLAGAPPPLAITASACPDSPIAQAATCRALAAVKDGQSAAAASAFEQAAGATPNGDPAMARAWAAAGNMWIAADQPAKAAAALERALALPGLAPVQRGEALLDRARAAEAQNDLKTARARLSEAESSIATDPFYWFFSAALAVREADEPVARLSIARALALAPSDPLVLFEAGHVAQFTGDSAKARDYWAKAAATDPGGDVGRAASDALAMVPVPLTVTNSVAKDQ